MPCWPARCRGSCPRPAPRGASWAGRRSGGAAGCLRQPPGRCLSCTDTAGLLDTLSIGAAGLHREEAYVDEEEHAVDRGNGKLGGCELRAAQEQRPEEEPERLCLHRPG